MNRGFTFIEIIVAIAIVMIVGAIVVPVGITQINQSVCRERYDDIRSQLVVARANAFADGTREYVRVAEGAGGIHVSSSGDIVFDGVLLARMPPIFQPVVTIRFEGVACDRSIIINEIGAII